MKLHKHYQRPRPHEKTYTGNCTIG
jgi:hypothetical protein